MWLLCFFIPPFLIALKAGKTGAIYGLVIGVVPVIIAFLIGYSTPFFIVFMFYMFAPMGGYFGELTSKLAFKP